MAKSETKTTALATKAAGIEFAIMKTDAEKVTAIIRENVGDAGVSVMDLDKITMPSGKTPVFTVPTLDGPDAVKEFTGIIIHWSDVRAYWAEAYGAAGGSNVPACSSTDCKVGVGEPGGPCAQCPYNEFGTAMADDGTAGKGKACGERRRLFIMTPNSVLPSMLSVPPTSLRDVRKFFQRMGGQGVPFNSVVMNFKLVPDKNDNGVDYYKLDLSIAGPLTEQQTEAMRTLRGMLLPEMSAQPITREDPTD